MKEAGIAWSQLYDVSRKGKSTETVDLWGSEMGMKMGLETRFHLNVVEKF